MLQTTTNDFQTLGRVKSVRDNVVLAENLPGVGFNEIVEFPRNGLKGLVLDMSDSQVGIIVYGDTSRIKEGDYIQPTGKLFTVRVSKDLLGRVVNAVLEPIDGQELTLSDSPKDMDVDKIAPGVSFRKSVNRPLQTGIKAIDAMVPIGRGQRELIIGDRKTGKSAIALDAIVNQARINDLIDKGEAEGKKVYSVYVAVGQKRGKIAKIIKQLRDLGAMKYTVVVSATASDSPTMLYSAPFTGTAIGEYFMDNGDDALIVYDDLTKHAWAYREISLLLKRPPGREAYPGDVFYLHSRLLERSAQIKEESGGGSLTALPIIETQGSDISAYIPTNVISITDGQIYLEPDLFNSGIRPAVNPGLSVSRVGGAAQIKGMKKVAGKIRLFLSQFRELEAFAKFGSEMDKETQKVIDRGRGLINLLKQDQFAPAFVGEQVVMFYLAANGMLEEVKIDEVQKFEEEFISFIGDTKPEIIDRFKTTGGYDDGWEKTLKESFESFKMQNPDLF